MDCKEGLVPSDWIKRCLIGKDLLPFCVRTGGTSFVMPLDKKGYWLKERNKNAYWKEICEIYRMHRGKGGHTPPTLEQRLNHHNALFAQADKSPPYLIYNTSGARLYAAVVKDHAFIDSSLYSVVCGSANEANFLCGILNSDVLQDAFTETKKAYKHYHTYYWNKIPIPRFDRNNNDHNSILTLVDDASTVAEKIMAENKNVQRKSILTEIRDCGILPKIDIVVSKILPEYVRIM